MKRLADFKRALTLGSKWKATIYDRRDEAFELGTREVRVIRQNSVGFDNGKGGISYLNLPKAKDYEYEKGIVKIFYPECKIYDLPRSLILTYEKIGD
jgi:hypothetical protein